MSEASPVPSQPELPQQLQQQQLLLRTSLASPFGRKVRMAIGVLGWANRVQVVVTDTSDPADPLREHNPLGKVPALTLSDGQTLFDSRVIVEYLDLLDGRQQLLRAGMERIAVLRQQALADGLLDAALLQVYEKRFRPETHAWAPWVAHQQGKVARALQMMAQEVNAIGKSGPHIGDIAQAAALAYLDLRFEGAWRKAHPVLRDWLEDFAAQVPAFGETRP